MKIELQGWSSEGLRCADANVDLTIHGKIAPVSLVQMPNGTGKTTTLKLLMATLAGEAEQWSPDEVRSLQRAQDKSLKGVFKVNLLVDDKPLTFELSLDFEEGQARYRTTSPGSGGVAQGYRPPPSVNPFLRPQFIDLFVLDGELARRLLDPAESEAVKAIDALCQLYLLQDISAFAEESWRKATKKSNEKTTSGLGNWQNAKAKISKRILELTTAQSWAKKDLDELDSRISKLAELIGTKMSRSQTINEQYESALRERDESEKRVSLLSAQLMQSIKLPNVLHPKLSDALRRLKGNLDRLKLPENTSAQFFEELAEEDHCICGREMTDTAREEIALRAKQYLGADENGRINEMKGDIDKFTAAEDGTSRHERLLCDVRLLGEAVRERQAAEGALRALVQRRIDQGDDQIAEWQNELQAKKQQFAEREALLKSMAASGDDAEDTDETVSIALLTRRLAEADRKISKITETVELHRQTKLIQKIAEEAKLVARDQIRSLVFSECNKMLRKVLSQDPLQLEKIDDSLHLAHQSGASSGQTLSVGYTFLMTVLERGQNQFPLIVDSPANPLDAGRRREIGSLIPKLCSQFIGFTISTERLGFVSALEAAEARIKYITIFRKTAGTADLMKGLPGKGVKQSVNAVMIEDRDYFNNFDLEEESE